MASRVVEQVPLPQLGLQPDDARRSVEKSLHGALLDRLSRFVVDAETAVRTSGHRREPDQCQTDQQGEDLHHCTLLVRNS